MPDGSAVWHPTRAAGRQRSCCGSGGPRAQWVGYLGSAWRRRRILCRSTPEPVRPSWERTCYAPGVQLAMPLKALSIRAAGPACTAACSRHRLRTGRVLPACAHLGCRAGSSRAYAALVLGDRGGLPPLAVLPPQIDTSVNPPADATRRAHPEMSQETPHGPQNEVPQDWYEDWLESLAPLAHPRSSSTSSPQDTVHPTDEGDR